MKKEQKKYEDRILKFKFEACDMEALDEVVALTGLNEASVVVNALSLYRDIMVWRKEKKRILIENRWGNTKELLFF